MCALPDYSIDMPPFTLYGSSANQTESITECTHTVTEPPDHIRRTEGGEKEGERVKTEGGDHRMAFCCFVFQTGL